MGHILSHILDTVVHYKKCIFLETDFVLLSSVLYKGETMLVIGSKTEVGNRILLNRKDLVTLQNLECAIFEAIAKKITVVRPLILEYFEQILECFINDKNINKSATLNIQSCTKDQLFKPDTIIGSSIDRHTLDRNAGG